MAKVFLEAFDNFITGFAPQWIMDSMVAINVKGVVITSSPGPIPHAMSARRIASVPLATPTAYLVLKYEVISFYRFILYL